ncbi:hypothetical protein BU17DRAFT_95259 [Hysterangium stoloniferum]|nr:hypothetical protein BU17DRAFT_95259 [Hysterangium stoloniferum]
MAVVESPSATGTKDFVRGFWDKNIKDVIELVLQQGQSIRNSNHNMETKNMCPDFGLLVQNVCVFRGVEKGPGNSEDPRAELVDKLTWVYSPAEYLLGYYYCGFTLMLVAICPPSEQGGKPLIQDLSSANLRPLSGARQELFNEVRFQHLENVYASLYHRNVPNTDCIILILMKGKSLYLAPRGIPVPPKIQVDLRECVVCVLEALVDAATPPTKGQPRFNMSDHSPCILEDNHGVEVDIWGVGHLITSSTASEFKALGKRVCEEAHILTAQEVLKLVKLLP